MVKLKKEKKEAIDDLAESISQGNALLGRAASVSNEEELHLLVLETEGWKENVSWHLMQLFDKEKIAKDFADWKTGKNVIKTFEGKRQEFRKKLDVNIRALEFLKTSVEKGWYSENYNARLKQKPFGPYRQYGMSGWDLIHKYIWPVSITAILFIIILCLGFGYGYLKLNKEHGTKLTVRLPQFTEMIPDDQFMADLKLYTRSILRNEKEDIIDEDEWYNIADVYYTDSVIQMLIIRRNENKGMHWAGDGTHYKSTAFLLAIKKDSSTRINILEREVYPTGHGCINITPTELLAFISYKHDKDQEECEWRGKTIHFPLGRNSKTEEPLFSKINGGFYPYYKGDTVVHLNMGGYAIYNDGVKADSSGENAQRRQVHLDNYNYSVSRHSQGLLANPVESGYEADKTGKHNEAFEIVVNKIRDKGWLN